MEEDTLGHSADNSIMNLTASLEEEVFAPRNGDKVSTSSQPEEMDHEYAVEEWPALPESPTFTEVVKSPSSAQPDHSQEEVPKLSKSLPQVTRNRPRAKPGNRSRGKRNTDPFNVEVLSKDDRAFLEAGSNRKDSRRSDKSSKSAKSNKNRSKNYKLKATSTPNNPTTAAHSLSPEQRAAMTSLGLPPDSIFVKNVITSRAARK